MLMAIKLLVALHTKATIETVNQITQFLNYSATHPDAVTEFRKSEMILPIYSDASSVSEPEVQSRSGGYLFLGPKFNTTIQ